MARVLIHILGCGHCYWYCREWGMLWLDLLLAFKFLHLHLDWPTLYSAGHSIQGKGWDTSRCHMSCQACSITRVLQSLEPKSFVPPSEVILLGPTMITWPVDWSVKRRYPWSFKAPMKLWKHLCLKDFFSKPIVTLQLTHSYTHTDFVLVGPWGPASPFD